MNKNGNTQIEKEFNDFLNIDSGNIKEDEKATEDAYEIIADKNIETEFNAIFGEEIAKKKSAKNLSKKDDHAEHRKRVYEKIKKDAFNTFQDYEVLEIMLFSSHARRDTKPQAKRLIKAFGSLQKVMDASRYEIKALGFSDKVASVIEVYRGVAERYLYQRTIPDTHIDSREKAKKYIHALCDGKKTECVYCVYLDSSKKILECEKLAEGDSSNVVVYTEELFRKVSILRAKYIIIGHNHPSGILTPSLSDLNLLEEINKGVMALRCYVYDAIITCDTDSISLAEEGYFRDNEFFRVAKETQMNHKDFTR